ncbi:phage minor head protein [Aliarcobacter lanthieri]|uniref:phage head morphogenesis protein n=1 Tax=Aliarcobacter lanthieri TaxID=1355374 RepID=UPI003AAE637B
MKITQTKSKWATSRNANIFGSPLKPNAATEERYKKQLDQIIELMFNDYNRQVKKLVTKEFKGYALDSSLANQSSILMNYLSKKWYQRFTKVANAFIKIFIKQVDTNATKSLESSLKQLSGGITITPPKMPLSLQEKLQAHIKENVALIKSIPEEFHLKIENSINRSIQQGLGTKDIYDTALENMKQGKFNQEKRASLIARLETAKVTSSIQLEKMKSVGITKFRWRHSGGGFEPRKLHQDYDGKIFSFDDLPILDEKTGQRGLPGTIWNCRCYLEPVIEFNQTS